MSESENRRGSRRSLSLLLFALNLAFWGCGGGGCQCSLLCSVDNNNPPITGSITWRPDPLGGVMDVVAIPPGPGTPKKICVEMTGPDPSAGQNWTIQNWLSHLRIGARATDPDSVFPQAYSSEECNPNTSTVPYNFNSSVQMTWSGNVQWETGEYVLTVTIKNPPGLKYPEFAPVSPECEPPSDTAVGRVTLVLYRVEIDGVKGPTSVERGKAEQEYKVDVNVAGFADSPPIKYDWDSNWVHPVFPTASNTWKGLLVIGTTVNCDVLVTFPNDCFLIGGQTLTYGATRKVTAVTPRRDWAYFPPGTAEFKEMDDLSDVGPWVPCPDGANSPEGAVEGVLVDKGSRGNWIFAPNPNQGDRSWYGTGGAHIAHVGDAGPNDPLWWIDAASFSINQLARITQYINENGPPPLGATTSENWYSANSACFNSPAIYYAAVKSHENLGEWSLPAGGTSGHYGRIYWGATQFNNDYKRILEGGVDTSFLYVHDLVNYTMTTLDSRLNDIGDPGHNYVKGNFSALGGEVSHGERDFINGQWSTVGGGRTCPCGFDNDF